MRCVLDADASHSTPSVHRGEDDPLPSSLASCVDVINSAEYRERHGIVPTFPPKVIFVPSSRIFPCVPRRISNVSPTYLVRISCHSVLCKCVERCVKRYVETCMKRCVGYILTLFPWEFRDTHSRDVDPIVSICCRRRNSMMTNLEF